LSAYLWAAILLVAPVLAVALAARLAAFFATVREKRRHARRLGGLGEPVRDVAGIVARSLATLEGRLAAEWPVVSSFHPYGTSFLEEPNVYAQTAMREEGSLVVELEDGVRVRLEGDLQVLAGSVESEHTAPLGAAEFPAERSRRGQFRELRAGDRVLVRGLVEPAPDDGALYRERSKALRMHPQSGSSPAAPAVILLASTIPPRPCRKGPRYGAWTAFGGALAVGVVMSATLPPRLVTSSAGVQTSARSQVPACRARLLLELQKNHFVESGDDARTCDDAYARALVLYANGRFAEASGEFERAEADPSVVPSLTEVESHLFAHESARAARVLRRMIDAFYRGLDTAESRYLGCIGGLLDQRVAEGGPFRTLCSNRAFAKFARDLEGSPAPVDDLRDQMNGVYRKEAVWELVTSNPSTALVATRARLFGRPVAVERLLLDRGFVAPSRANTRWEAEEREDAKAFAADLTLFYAFAGFPERSASYWPVLDDVAEELERPPTRAATADDAWREKAQAEQRTRHEYVLSVGAAAALLAHDAGRVKRYTAVCEVHAAHVITQAQQTLAGAPWEEPAEDGHWPEHKAIFDAALTGDGAAVRAVLVKQGSTGDGTLARALPRVVRNRDALRRWYDDEYPTPCMTCGASSFIGHLAERRDAARLLDVRDEAERLQSIAAHFTDALADPTIAFELDELETFFDRKR
jgi:hypothetical protein